MRARILARAAKQVSLAELSKRLDEVADEPAGRWRVTCSYFRPGVADAGLEDLFVFVTSETELHYVVHIDKAAKASRVLEAESQIGALIDGMQTHTQRLKVTAEGTAHRCGDFVVRSAQLFHNSVPAGIVVEVEYLACDDPSAELAPLHEFLDHVLPPAQREFCSAAAACCSRALGLPARSSMQHAALQFVAMVRARLLHDGAEPEAGASGARKRERG